MNERNELESKKEIERERKKRRDSMKYREMTTWHFDSVWKVHWHYLQWGDWFLVDKLKTRAKSERLCHRNMGHWWKGWYSCFRASSGFVTLISMLRLMKMIKMERSVTKKMENKAKMKLRKTKNERGGYKKIWRVHYWDGGSCLKAWGVQRPKGEG